MTEKMKKIFSILIVCLALVGASDVCAQHRFGVVAGADFTTLRFDDDLFSVNTNVGLTAGVTSELMIPGIGFGVDASLLYTQRGAKLNLGERPVWGLEGYGKEKCVLHYIDIPVHLKFKFKNLNGLENTFMPILFAGPEISFLAGHSNLPVLDYRRCEFGVNVGLGCELISCLQVNASYCWGLSNALQTKVLDEFTAKNLTWKVTCTYLF